MHPSIKACISEDLILQSLCMACSDTAINQYYLLATFVFLLFSSLILCGPRHVVFGLTNLKIVVVTVAHYSIVVSIPACHAGDRGSIPRRGAM